MKFDSIVEEVKSASTSAAKKALFKNNKPGSFSVGDDHEVLQKKPIKMTALKTENKPYANSMKNLIDPNKPISKSAEESKNSS